MAKDPQSDRKKGSDTTLTELSIEPENSTLRTALSRLMEGTIPPVDVAVYYKCIYYFLMLCIYLVIGGMFLWAIERQFGSDDLYTSPEGSSRTLKNKNHNPNSPPDWPLYEFSSTWSIFDAIFVCYTLASGSGPYAEMSVDTTLGKAFVMIYASLGCPIVALVTTNMTLIMIAWAQSMSIFLKNCMDVISNNNNAQRNRPRKDENPSQSKLSGLTAFLCFFIYTAVGSFIFFYRKNTAFFETFYTSFSAFVTLEVGKPFNAPIRALITLIYVLFGVSSFQICVECLKNELDSYLFKTGIEKKKVSKS